ncbi:hypothetical protein DFA_12208 [Cavenderia fasciculata]|uniref:YjgF-like protein n=1 Tax=Cavenderia fasciculata TaxID=261658 RepID=F4QCK8_CACFS|nr:uncharacterized protein DFA_12208 [Cavenderia fasciculata]EGG14436.1 hypothetical protein DFA_12208 [Cavenderia fasciculata]|eukprot:XP_004353845.1 hypothetical protein DFA_12208 [Cavenderia fasciculata]
MSRVVVSTPNAPAAIGPYSQAIKANGQVWVSGCLGLDKDDDVELQTHKALENMKAILEAAGSSMNKVVKTTILLKDINDFVKVNKVYASFFPAEPPARSTFAVRDLPKAVMIRYISRGHHVLGWLRTSTLFANSTIELFIVPNVLLILFSACAICGFTSQQDAHWLLQL